MKRNIAQLAIILLGIMATNCGPREEVYDIVVYGATSAGISAAVEASRSGRSVIVIEPGIHIGGLTTGGLGATDIGNKRVIGGISREFYERVAAKYLDNDHWVWEDMPDIPAQTEEGAKPARWTFEPRVASEVMNDLITENHIIIRTNERLDRADGVRKSGGVIQSISMESGLTVFGRMFIDASYEGDLLAAAGVSYTVGREPNSLYAENLNGVQKKRGIYHQFPDGVDPYLIPNDPASGLLGDIDPDPGQEGEGDSRVQAYCFRMCLTDVPENRVMVEKPAGYNEGDYELLFRAFEAGYDGPQFIMSPMPNRKTDSNNKGPFSSDFIGHNYEYPEAGYEEREKIIREHEVYQRGLLWTLANHPRVPDNVRDEFQNWGLPKDEFTNTGHWTPQLYIREARRMISDFVMTEHHCTQDSVTAPKSVGMGAYTMDSHHMQRYVDENGWVKNEGDVEVGGFGPYPISYDAIVPRKIECENLLVPVCLSASHIAFGSIRMEPVFMILGQSAATAAVIALESGVPVQDIEYGLLEDRLVKDGQILEDPVLNQR